ncbi:chromodomain Y-like protein [Daphnia pulicaria]|uniref:chromodomain Y-like protein n=1 Tax=Daphnia pulicaria TaxID=35523 RepID=UPI001EEAE47D|nr:chromodomain Y-like protein [Daphnia pulicaria]
MASVSNTESDEFVVDRILYKGVYNRKTMYLVKWMGYDNTDNTWEPSSNMQNCKELVSTFNQWFKHYDLPVQKLTAAVVANPQIATQQNNHLMDRNVVTTQLWGLVSEGFRAGMVRF